MLEKLRKDVFEANLELVRQRLVIFSWGNVSGIDRGEGLVVIKPSGVDYDKLTVEDLVVVDMQGEVIEGDLKPSSDTATHLELYRNFADIGGVCHTHSRHATMWAQACRPIPCFGTTHADYYYGQVPVTEYMQAEEVESDYELNTGKVIVRRFADIEPLDMPGVLVANHGPFTWGKTAAKAVESAVVLEEVATMAVGTIEINPQQGAIADYLLDKHFLRKHGKDAYYGQNH